MSKNKKKEGYSWFWNTEEKDPDHPIRNITRNIPSKSLDLTDDDTSDTSDGKDEEED